MMQLIIDKAKQKTTLPRIMRAAVRLFVEKGIDGTSIKDIAEKADVSEGALYRHFKSKDELAWSIFTTNLNEFSIDLMAKVSEQEKTKDRIRAFILACFTAFEEDRDLFTYLIVSEHRELRDLPSSHMHPGHVARRFIEEGQHEGEFRLMDIYIASSILVGSLIRMCVVRMYGGIAEDLREHVDSVSESIWLALKSE